ncbi:site-2 protease family protein [Streptomyces sp. NPDC048566]|uniref:site-2 protease family protein n=1 Tax=Streptomyces sp. NPDC048566 TaxID=3365569 RepID=UPI0037186498
MDESGGNGQPRSGTGGTTEGHGRPGASAGPAADTPRPGPAGPETPTGTGPADPGHDAGDAAPGGGTAPADPGPSAGSAPDTEPGTPPRGDSAPATPGGGAAHARPAAEGDDDPETRDRPAPGSDGHEDRPSAAQPPPPHPDQDRREPAGPGTPDASGPRQAPAHRTLAHSGDGRPAGGGAPGGGRGRGGRPPRRRNEPGGGLLMGRPFGVPVYVAPSWFLVAALITWVFGGQLDRVLPELGAARYLVSLFFAVAFYASVLVHELAHTVAALRFKLPVRRIQLQFFGGVSEIEKEAETPGREFVLAFVGPLLSLVLAGVFYLALLPVEPGTVPGVLLAGLMISNLIVAAFNLLPGLPLDGGRMLRAVVWKITGRPMSGTVAAAWVGRALAVSVLVGLPLLTQTSLLGSAPEDSSGMDTVTDALLAAILAAIIWTGAGNSLRMARLREHLPELRARSLTRRAVPVETGTPLSEALRRANDAGARALVVVDTDGEPLSLVREAAIVGVPEHRRPWVAVSGLAQDLTDGMRVSAELAGEELLDVLRATPATEYLVVEDSGEIYGVLSAADVERAFVKAMARPA